MGRAGPCHLKMAVVTSPGHILHCAALNIILSEVFRIPRCLLNNYIDLNKLSIIRMSSISGSQITPMLNHTKSNPIRSHLEGDTRNSFSALQDILRSLVGVWIWEIQCLGLFPWLPNSTDEEVIKRVTIRSSCITGYYNVTILSFYRWFISCISCHWSKEYKFTRIKQSGTICFSRV